MEIKHIIAFGASNSKFSINQQFAEYTAHQFTQAQVESLRITDYPVPIYGIDWELEYGIPSEAEQFAQRLALADLLIISLAEHNGSYTAAFKTLWDWCSRRERKMFENSNLLLLSTTPGEHGATRVMQSALLDFPLHGAHIIEHFSLRNFNDTFSPLQGILNSELNKAYRVVIQNVQKFLDSN